MLQDYTLKIPLSAEERTEAIDEARDATVLVQDLEQAILKAKQLLKQLNKDLRQAQKDRLAKFDIVVNDYKQRVVYAEVSNDFRNGKVKIEVIETGEVFYEDLQHLEDE